MSDVASVMSSVSPGFGAGISMGGGAPAIGSNLNLEAAKKAGKDFESFFLSQTFESMFSGVDADPIFGGGEGESTYRSLMIQEYSKVASQNGSTGIAAAVTREILKMQEKQQQA
jgi:Rod binding domain-containing protein